MFKLEQKKEYLRNISTEANKDDRMEILLGGINAINQCETIASVVNESIKIVTSLTDADIAYVLLLDQEKDTFSNPPLSNEDGVISWSVQKNLAQEVLEEREIISIRDFQYNVPISFRKLSDDAVQEMVGIPLINSKDNIVGVLQTLTLEGKNSFSKEVVVLVEMLARHIGCVIESINRANELESKRREEALMRTEIHHRLKNNLSTVTSLIEVDLPEISDEHAANILKKTSSRIKSITEVHNLLCQVGGRKNVDLADYFRQLARKIIKTLSKETETVTITVDADILEIDADRAMSCGLIMNELILNAYKHAFVSMREGEIKIALAESEDGMIEIIVSDNGKGIGNKFAVDQEGSIGCWVIKALADRLDASIDVSSNNGTTYALRFAR